MTKLQSLEQDGIVAGNIFAFIFFLPEQTEEKGVEVTPVQLENATKMKVVIVQKLPCV